MLLILEGRRTLGFVQRLHNRRAASCSVYLIVGFTDRLPASSFRFLERLILGVFEVTEKSILSVQNVAMAYHRLFVGKQLRRSGPVR